MTASPPTPSDGALQAECLRRLTAAHRLVVRPPLSAATIHRVRTHLKSAEALLRLLRPALRVSDYREAMRLIRAVRRQLGAMRDVTVNMAEFARVMQNNALRDTWARSAVAEWSHEWRVAVADADFVAMANNLTSVRKTLSRERLPVGRRSLRVGLRRLYRRAATCCAKAISTPSEAGLHRCRQRTQHLRYALDFAEPWLSKRDRRLRQRAKTLGTQLGEYRDLLRLSRHIDTWTLSSARLRTLQTNVQSKLTAALSASTRAAQRMYRKKTPRFKRLRRGAHHKFDNAE